LRQIGGEHIPVAWLAEAKLPDHLQVKVRVVDEKGATVAAGADVDQIKRTLHGQHVARLEETAAAKRWTVDSLTDWTFGALPASVDLDDETASKAYPMLVDAGTTVGLRLSHHPEIAERNTRRALMRLFAIAEAKKIAQQVAWLPKIEPWSMQAASILTAAETLAAKPAGATTKGFIAQFGNSWDSESPSGRPPILREIPRDDAAIASSESGLESGERRRPGDGRTARVPAAEGARSPETRRTANVAGPGSSAARQSLAMAAVVSAGLSRRDAVGVAAVVSPLPRCPGDPLEEAPRWRPRRDRELMSKVTLFWNKYLEFVTKRPAVLPAFEPVRWLIEEYRVSLFAQQCEQRPPSQRNACAKRGTPPSRKSKPRSRRCQRRTSAQTSHASPTILLRNQKPRTLAASTTTPQANAQ